MSSAGGQNRATSCTIAADPQHDEGTIMEEGSVVACDGSVAGSEKEPAGGTSTNAESTSVCAFFLQGRCRFGDKCRNVHPGDDPSKTIDSMDNNEAKRPPVSSEHDLKNDQEHSSGNRVKCDGENGEQSSKKSPMRTAADVISRIRWDDVFADIRPLIIVGYLDRFYGTLERSFDSFNWEDDLASVGDNDLAIPQHRILFFKYRGEKIWDKESRLDLVFNCTGQGVEETIEDVLQRIDREFFTRLKDEVAAFGDGAKFEGQEDYSSYEDYDDDDDEDGANIVTGAGFGEAVRQQHSYNLDDRSTHFLAIKISNQDIIRSALMVQENATRLEPVLQDCCMKEGLFHITFCMLRFDDPSACHHARLLLEDSVDELRRIVAENVQPVEIRGLKTFGNRVLYAGVVPPLNFWSVEAFLRNKFSRPDLGIKLTNHFEFVPHMTIMKVSRPIARERKTKYLDPGLYVKYVDLDFGKQPLNNLNLCIIDESTRYDGFYQTLAEVCLM